MEGAIKPRKEVFGIKCALEIMNIGPSKPQIMQSMGISRDELDDVSEQFEAMFGEDGGFEPGGAGTMPFLKFRRNRQRQLRPRLRRRKPHPKRRKGGPKE